ncbi:carboxy terminal-processing peptidase [Flavobacterium laiguense]|uniref:Peptidase S41 n=1 Tax=Flavobacterium laiguense TaxID=2169409 RepID=A0A2U1JVB2_9FLAO|nr:carboxy terminal-processing peptidase [Flavobacterium laiguense]PWA09151.1 peptidase S41 [Flavobacterium laiguense]
MNKISLVLFLFTYSLFGQNSNSTCEILFKINTLIQQEHINPKPVNDSLSAYVFDNLMNELDPSRNIFYKSQFDALSSKYRLHLNDYILKKDCSFISEIKALYKTNLERNKLILEKINKETLDFSQIDTIRFKQKKFSFYVQESDVEKVWRKKIRYEVLNDISGKSKNLDSIKNNFNSLLTKSKKTIIDNELCKVNVLIKSEKPFEDGLYNIYCGYFDPHTNYFSNDSKSSFVSTLSKEHLSIGLNVSLNSKNEIIVNEIDPNGPAFKTGKIKKGDQILSVSNQKETLQVSCASIESISTLLGSELNTSITLTLRRNAGKIFKVNIQKQVLKDEENTVYSFVIDKNIKIGYIKIPSFYSDFEGRSSKGCAQDVAKETIKLMKDDIKGLVIDLTDNGGGSMEEAIKLAGLFIESGPISILVDNKKRLSVINDPYKGVIYKGPVIIIINGNSASASEFFASIMQDYNRALLIGSTSLGKATMQTIAPLEKNDDQNFVKLSISKFYRITGKSHQAVGVIPDVQIPTIYQSVFQKESEFPTAIPNDSLNTHVRFKTYVKNSLIDELAQKSAKRVAEDPYFNSVKVLNSKIDLVVNKSKLEIPMTIDSIFEEQNNISNLWEEINNFDTQDLNLNVSNSNYNKSLLIIYPSEKEYNQMQLDALKSNHYLDEAIRIIEDFKALKRN